MKLFEPGRIGALELKNRIIMAPMGIGALAEPDGRLSRRAIDYYTERARGGAGMIVTGVTCVDVEIEKKAEHGLGTFARVDHPIHINPLSELADAVHDYGAKLCVQLTAGMGRVAYGALPREGKAVAPSETACFWAPEFNARQLTTEEVEGLVRAFGMAALYLKVAGVDAVQLHGHEGYLMDQFQSALWNRRTDKYGGDPERRLSFSKEVIRAIKARAGEDFPVIYRYGLVHYVEGGRELPESLEMAKHLEAAGVDALEADAGCYETWYWAHPPTYQPPGCMVDMAEAVKGVVGIPVISVGKLGYPDLAESVLETEKADFICLGRALLADPDWPEKVRKGRVEDIRPCIGDHTGCLGRVFQGKTLSCTVNPAAGNERAFALRPTRSPRSILVVGGGPGGMQAAMAAAERGHRVQLWEKGDRLGGTLIPASVPDFKRDLRDLAVYLSRRVERSGTAIWLEKEAEAHMVESAGADVVIVATGALPVMPEVPGAETNRIVTAIDLFKGKAEAGDDVLIIGGGLVGCEAALYLAQTGRRVTVVEMLGRICQGENQANRQHLIKLISDAGVNVLTGSTISEITAEGGIAATGDKEDMITADTIVMAAGMRSENALYESLVKKLPEVHRLGDCVKPRRVMEAIWEGFRTARLL